MWMSIMILCGSVYAQSCMVITGNDLYPNKEACFKSAIEKANKAIELINKAISFYPKDNDIKDKRYLI